MRRIFIYLFATLTFVGCTTMEPSFDPEGPGPKPVRPIKPRPIVPDGTILRPRLGIWDLIALPKPLDCSYSCRMQLRTQCGKVLYDEETMVCDGFVELPNVDCNEELMLIIEKESTTYCFTIAEKDE